MATNIKPYPNLINGTWKASSDTPKDRVSILSKNKDKP